MLPCSYCALSEIQTVNFSMGPFVWDSKDKTSQRISLNCLSKKRNKFKKAYVDTRGLRLFIAHFSHWACFFVVFKLLSSQWAHLPHPAAKQSGLITQKREEKLERTKWGQREGPWWSPSCLGHRGPTVILLFWKHILKLFRHHSNTCVNLSAVRHAF